jgi:hypothetical protein
MPNEPLKALVVGRYHHDITTRHGDHDGCGEYESCQRWGEGKGGEVFHKATKPRRWQKSNKEDDEERSEKKEKEKTERASAE